MMGSRVVSWSSRKQPIMILSKTKAEFVAASLCDKFLKHYSSSKRELQQFIMITVQQ